MDFVTGLLKYQLQFSICHWQTDTPSHHLAAGEISAGIQDFVKHYVDLMEYDMDNQHIDLSNCATEEDGTELIFSFLEFMKPIEDHIIEHGSPMMNRRFIFFKDIIDRNLRRLNILYLF